MRKEVFCSFLSSAVQRTRKTCPSSHFAVWLLRCARLGYSQLIDRFFPMAAAPIMSSRDHHCDSDWPEQKIQQSKTGLGDEKQESGCMLTDLSWRYDSVCAQRAPAFRSSTTTLSWVRRQIHCQPHLFLCGLHHHLVENPAPNISHCRSLCWQGLTSSTAVSIP